MGELVPLESAVVARGHRLLKSRGAWFVKTTGVHMVGCPDTIACYKGYFIAIEWKRSGTANKRRAQEAQLQKITKAGGYGFFAWNMDELTRVMDTIDAHSG